MSISQLNNSVQTGLVPNTLLGYSTNGVSAIEITPTAITIAGDLNTPTPIYVGISASTGLTTTLSTGLDVNCSFNMNSNDITNLNSINGSSGNDIGIISSNQVNISSTDNTNINTGVNLIVNSNDSVILNGNGGSDGAISLNAPNANIQQTAQYIRLRDGINDEEIILDMGTNTDQVPRITLTHRGQNSTIYNTDNLNIDSDQQLISTIGKAITFQSNNDNTSLYNPNGSVFISKTNAFAGDGDIYASNFYGNASTASFATSSASAGRGNSLTTTGISSSASLFYLPFVNKIFTI